MSISSFFSVPLILSIFCISDRCDVIFSYSFLASLICLSFSIADSQHSRTSLFWSFLSTDENFSCWSKAISSITFSLTFSLLASAAMPSCCPLPGILSIISLLSVFPVLSVLPAFFVFFFLFQKAIIYPFKH